LIPCGGRRYSKVITAVLNHPHTRRLRSLFPLLAILVLVCVPGLTRIGQKLETASHTLSFAKNIDCPPKRVTIAPMAAVEAPTAVNRVETAPVARFAPVPDLTHPRPLYLSSPRPLRAPPAVPFA